MAEIAGSGFVKYVVKCYSCGNPFDAMETSLCSCIHKTRSFVCPSCLSCFCSAPQSYKLQFWSAAPQELWKKRMEKPEYEPALPKEGAAVQRPLVLLVEDEKDIRAVAALAIESLGYSTIVAQDGNQGLEMARKYLPDVVVTDALMPKMDGREMCKQIKDDPATRGIRVLVISAVYTANKYKTQAVREFGADEYLPKPVDFNKLRTTLQRLAG